MEKDYSRGAIVFVDAVGVAHGALVTRYHGVDLYEHGKGHTTPTAEWAAQHGEPGVNLVYVSEDANKTDPYGQQIERQTSVVHKSRQPAAGMYWCWPSELK